MRYRPATLLAAALLCLSQAHAGTILTVFGTGVGDLGAPLFERNIDPHFSDRDGGIGPATLFVDDAATLGWERNMATSNRISLSNAGGDGTADLFTNSTAFDLTDFDPRRSFDDR